MRMELPKNKTLNLNKMFSGIEFANPWMLLLLILLPSIGIWYYVKRNQQHPVFNLSSTHPLHSFPKSIRQRLIILLPVLRMLCIGFIIIALARPQTKSSSQDVSVEGIDIAMALDISGSMLAEDFKPNRLEAAKKLTQKFIESRPNDRMGLVVFSGSLQGWRIELGAAVCRHRPERHELVQGAGGFGRICRHAGIDPLPPQKRCPESL